MKFWHVDAHVHLHGETLSPSLVRDLGHSAVEQTGGRSESCQGVVWCLADMPGVETMSAIGHEDFRAQLKALGAATVEFCAPIAYIAGAGWSVRLVDGEQLVSSEGLEVIVTGGRLRPTRQQPASQIIDTALEKGLLPVLPWGVGKWLGRRGEIIRDLMSNKEYRGRLALADSGTRPSIWPEPRCLSQASSSGIAVLNGSDSLRVANDQRRTGQFGVYVPAVSGGDVMSDLKTYVSQSDAPRFFGTPIATWHFLKSQVLLRFS